MVGRNQIEGAVGRQTSSGSEKIEEPQAFFMFYNYRITFLFVLLIIYKLYAYMSEIKYLIKDKI